MANKIYDAFDGIKADARLKETTMQYIGTRYAKKSGRSLRISFRKMLALACMALVFVAAAGGYTWIQTPVSYLSIDVNPSIELALNRFDRVVSVAAYNEQGEEILKNLSLKGKKYTDAIDAIVDDDTINDYLTEENGVVFTIAADSSREQALQTGVEKCSRHIVGYSESVSADIGIVSKAHEYGLSVGKYYAWLQLSRYDDTVTVEECKGMSIGKIHDLTWEHAHGHNEDDIVEEIPEDDGTGDGISEDETPENNVVDDDGTYYEEDHGCCHHDGHE